MIRRLVVSCGLVCAALALAACDSGRQAPGRVGVRVVNVAPGFIELDFQREQATTQNQPITLSFKGAQDAEYDADTYDFFVFDPSGQVGPWTFTPTLEENTRYTFVLTEVSGQVQPVVLSHTAPPSGEAQILALHAASGLPAMDLYLERPGVGIAGATPRGTFAPLEQISARTIPGGEYEITLTAAGNPADVLFESTMITLTAATTSTFIVVPEGGQSTSTLSVLALGATSTVLYDRNVTTQLRVINAATDGAPRDFAIDDQFSPPSFSAIPFGEPTQYTTVSVGSHKINVTPVGNPGVLELDQTYSAVADQRATVLFSGPAGELKWALGGDDLRRVHGAAKIRFMNATSQFPAAIEFVVTAPGEDPSQQLALSAPTSPGISVFSLLAPGTYDLHLRHSTTTPVAGPIPITVAGDGIYSVLAVDGPDTATATVLLLDDFP